MAFWFEADMGGGDILRSCPPPPWTPAAAPAPASAPGGNDVDAATTEDESARGGERAGSTVSGDNARSGDSTSIPGGGGSGDDGCKASRATASTRYFDANSWGTAVQYMDELDVDVGEPVAVRVRRDAAQIFFTSAPPPTRPRHAHIPQWHYDMLNDAGRNGAYDAAIIAEIARRKGGGGSGKRVDVLDAGAGSGLLSMMAARAGADFVTAVEQATHMTDAGEETVCMNGYGGSVLSLNKDVRRVFTAESDGLVRGGLKPDGTQVEMERAADVMVYEVFDSGLIGEGVLHILAAARHRLLAGDATLIPARATVFAQAVEMRVGTVHCGGSGGNSARVHHEQAVRGGGGDARSTPSGPGSEGCEGGTDFTLDMSQANRWRWRADYEGVNLEKCRDKWRALGDPVQVFDFDFYDVSVNDLRPAARALDVAVTAAGVFNAVVFWFELHLDDTTSVSTSPHDGTKGQTWQQAVQYLEEVTVAPGDVLPLVASHDTYSISFEVDDARFPDRAARRTGMGRR